MKLFWMDLREWNKDAATTAIESGADAVVAEKAAKVRELGLVKVISSDGDLVLDKDAFEVEITDKKSEEKAAELGKRGYVIVSTTDWTVIPLENLVAQSDRIIAAVSSAKEAETALGVLEGGVAGILLKNTDPNVIKSVSSLVKKSGGKLELSVFTVKSVKSAGMGDRVCVDTCTMMHDGEGMAVGNTSSAFLLVHAETLENPYVSPRPFRVNAGAVHSYALVAGGKTSYLSEISAGDRVLIVNSTGETEEATVGRVKIEKRPLLLIEAEPEGGGALISAVLQNAETIRLMREDGSAVSVIDLKPGDRILGRMEKGGRHFGHAIEETILEK